MRITGQRDASCTAFLWVSVCIRSLDRGLLCFRLAEGRKWAERWQPLQSARGSSRVACVCLAIQHFPMSCCSLLVLVFNLHHNLFVYFITLVSLFPFLTPPRPLCQAQTAHLVVLSDGHAHCFVHLPSKSPETSKMCICSGFKKSSGGETPAVIAQHLCYLLIQQPKGPILQILVLKQIHEPS